MIRTNRRLSPDRRASIEAQLKRFAGNRQLPAQNRVLIMDNRFSDDLDTKIKAAAREVAPSEEAIARRVREMIRTPDDGRDGMDGRTPTTDEIMALIQPLMQEHIDTANTLREELAAIKSLIAAPKEIPQDAGAFEATVAGIIDKKRPLQSSGGGTLYAYELDDMPDRTGRFGKPYEGKSGKFLKVKSDGSGFEFGTGGSGGITVETPAETPDGSTTVFTVSAEPQYVIADAGTYFDGAGYSYNSGTGKITMDAAVSQYIRVII